MKKNLYAIILISQCLLAMEASLIDYTQSVPKDVWKQKIFPQLISYEQKKNYADVKKMKLVSKFFYSLCDSEEVHRLISSFPIISTLALNTKSKRKEFDTLFLTADYTILLFIFRQAVKYNVKPVVVKAMERGANPNGLYDCNSKKTTALCQAAAANNLEAAQALLDFPTTDPNLPEESTDTPLIIAAKKNHPEMIRLLLQHSQIDPKKRNQAGQTARSIALTSIYDRAARILIWDQKLREEKEKEQQRCLCCLFPPQASPSICIIC